MKRTPLTRKQSARKRPGPAVSGRGGKYRNKRCQWGGRIYDSRLEAAVASDLQTLAKAGAISDLAEQVRHELYLRRACSQLYEIDRKSVV